MNVFSCVPIRTAIQKKIINFTIFFKNIQKWTIYM